MLTEWKLTIWCGSSCTLGWDFRWCSSYRGVAVAPGQIVFTLAVCGVGEAGDITLTIPGEEGASLGGDEGGILCSGGSFKDRTTADTGICVIILL